MVYTNNTPQGNQTIAATQPLILNNFGFLNTGLAVEHNFNAAGTGSDMYHLKASMPENADPGAPTAPCTGTYYVNSSAPKFRNATGIFNICSSFPGNAVFRTATPPGYTSPSTINTVLTTIQTLPANSLGSYWISRTGSTTEYAIGTWNTTGAALVLHSDHNSGFIGAASGLNFQLRTTSGTYNDVIFGFLIITP